MADDTVPQADAAGNPLPAWKRAYLKNPEAWRARTRKWQAKNRDKVNAANRERAKRRTPEQIEKRQLAQAAWRAANADRIREANRARSAALSAKRKAARDAKPQRTAEEKAAALKAYKRAWGMKQRAENPGARTAYKKAWAAQWREKNRTLANAQVTAWYKAHPEKEKLGRRVRAARRRAAEGRYTAKDIEALLALQKNRCAHQFCRVSLRDGYHADHIIPIALGGTNDRRNIQLLCPPCNHRKHAKHPIDFAQENGMLL